MGTSPSMFKLHATTKMDRQGPDRDIFFGNGVYEFRIETEEGEAEEMNRLLCPEWRHLFEETFN